MEVTDTNNHIYSLEPVFFKSSIPNVVRAQINDASNDKEVLQVKHNIAQ